MTLRNYSKIWFAMPLALFVLGTVALVLAACTGTSEPDDATATPVSPTSTPRTSDDRVLTTPELVERLTPSVVQIAVNTSRGQGVGTGVIFDDRGHILTNWHVVEGAINITVAFEDGSITEAELFRRDPLLDLAIIRVDHDELLPAIFGNSDQLEVGQDVVAIGHALGLQGGPTVSKGVVSALDRTILDDTGGNLSGLVQTDAAINEGNSGGPLVNMLGEVVGINTAKIQDGDRIGFSININDAKSAAESLIALGPVPPPGFLGVGGVDVNRAIARALRLPVAQGFGVTVIEPGSPADQAGIELDDIIVQLDDVEIRRGQDLTDFLRIHPAGTEISVTIVRDAEFLVTVQATLVERPVRQASGSRTSAGPNSVLVVQNVQNSSVRNSKGKLMTGQNTSELSGKVAIVTGAGRMRGIGRGSANVLARMGAHVVVTGTGRNPESFPEDEKQAGWKDIDSTVEEIESFGVRGLPLVVDVADQAEVQKMIDDTVGEFGRLDIIVNNAAAPYGPDRVPVLDMATEVFKKVVDVKLLGTFYCSKAAAAQMVEQGEGGRIVNLSSTMGKSGRANTSAYNAADFAVDGFTQALSKELGEHAITANSVCPGLTETARLDPLGRTDRWDARLSEIPLGRASSDEEVGELIGFLCSPRAAYITGQSINVNGGVITER